MGLGGAVCHRLATAVAALREFDGNSIFLQRVFRIGEPKLSDPTAPESPSVNVLRSSRVLTGGAALAATALLTAIVPTARADEPMPRGDQPRTPWFDLDSGGPKTRFEALLGLSMISSTDYLGSSRRSVALRPLGAVRFGRFRLSTSGSSSLLDFGTVADEAGASLDLVRSSRFRIRTGLRLTSGRDSGDSDQLAGMPDVRKTALGRLSASYDLSSHWRLVSALNVDVLGRGSGLLWTQGVDYHHRLRPDTELRVGMGITVGNATHLRSYYGVPESAVTATRPAYEPGAGLKDAAVTANLTHALTPGWIAFGGLTYARLLGPAADSPLAFRKDNVAVMIGLAWRYKSRTE